MQPPLLLSSSPPLLLSSSSSLPRVQLYGNLCTKSDAMQAGIRGMRCKLVDPEALLDDQFNFKNLPSGMHLHSQLLASRPNALEDAVPFIQQALALLNTTDSVSARAADVELLLGNARALLPECLTGQVGPGNCDSTCGNWSAYFLLPFFLFIGVYIMLNLVISALLRNYSAACSFSSFADQYVIFEPMGPKLTKRQLLQVLKKWRKQARLRDLYVNELKEARRMALVMRDQLIDAIQQGSRQTARELLEDLGMDRLESEGVKEMLLDLSKMTREMSKERHSQSGR
ncbi:hypothetical protein GUITHDRAFT_136532 [Guillardia theta CCMP2712]|uniref:Uncharacterized protein n=1 Tax=Guillardia theta (strain CCMP2712) TaxID=905079 RepID=L1JK51_GUITC|nr:hypothetical protein GUITHDRAFT_136532 [Guillardia theta CCMP2712]EKX48898.1 hypothetical protein GUITHDRAFT_136532 [Guillardia theta CCMP2712]|eukprot:XP_005835878.1 hypothetical protein GUITHDRAFT_136532 [Guillardia theta CCMP2712]